MSNLANKTEYKALNIIARMVKEFERLHYLDMTKIDDFDATLARNLLESIIHSNGFKVNYNKNTKKPLIKQQ
ncbi:hypothetical protein SAMN05421841_1814 [Chryseobacterium wanjuense]|uniref:Uncharacterized protein n=1 Tax=Chryseobacterium wanjuense TaxID=356305 RepID=A0A1I0QCD4_9FLAO|nr:hypothetical protein [Chryseobacterium wanjuense]SEW24717.1 hypothetical protein SAMN05421841_1814 [Chryseobacterium wanjuense]